MIFETLKKYATKFNVVEERAFTAEELAQVNNASIVASNYGNSMCFTMKAGGKCYIPMSNDATLGIGEEVDLTKATIITLKRDDEEIKRIKI